MAEPIDIEALTSPIPGENPAGTDLREDTSSAYFTARFQSDRARRAERKFFEGLDNEIPDWAPIIEILPSALQEQTKDLDMAAWLTEALVREQGFDGLRDGFTLMRRLVENFWESGLYPRREDKDDGVDVSVLQALDSTLVGPINRVGLTEPSGDLRSFSRWDYEQAPQIDRIDDPEERARRIEEGAATVAMLDEAEERTSAEFRQRTIGLIDECMEQFGGLIAFLEEHAGEDDEGEPIAPSWTHLREALEACRAIVEGGKPDSLDAESGADDEFESDSDGEPARTGPIKSRREAFRQLEQVARYFEGCEPHSPVSYALRRIVRWGDLSLPKLLSELIEDESARSDVYKLVGIREESSGEEPSED